MQLLARARNFGDVPALCGPTSANCALAVALHVSVSAVRADPPANTGRCNRRSARRLTVPLRCLEWVKAHHLSACAVDTTALHAARAVELRVCAHVCDLRFVNASNSFFPEMIAVKLCAEQRVRAAVAQ